MSSDLFLLVTEKELQAKNINNPVDKMISFMHLPFYGLEKITFEMPKLQFNLTEKSENLGDITYYLLQHSGHSQRVYNRYRDLTNTFRNRVAYVSHVSYVDAADLYSTYHLDKDLDFDISYKLTVHIERTSEGTRHYLGLDHVFFADK